MRDSKEKILQNSFNTFLSGVQIINGEFIEEQQCGMPSHPGKTPSSCLPADSMPAGQQELHSVVCKIPSATNILKGKPCLLGCNRSFPGSLWEATFPTGRTWGSKWLQGSWILSSGLTEVERGLGFPSCSHVTTGAWVCHRLSQKFHCGLSQFNEPKTALSLSLRSL